MDHPILQFYVPGLDVDWFAADKSQAVGYFTSDGCALVPKKGPSSKAIGFVRDYFMTLPIVGIPTIHTYGEQVSAIGAPLLETLSD